MIRRLIGRLKLWLSQKVYKFLTGLAANQNIKALSPAFLRNFVSKAVLKRVVEVYDRERLLQRVDEKTILLADYPRCGIAWIRFTMATVLHYRKTGEFRKMTNAEMGNYCPSVHSHDEFNHSHFNGGTKFAKTHSHYHPNYRRAMTIYRNPFEAIKSLYTLESYTLDDVDFELSYVSKREGHVLSGEKYEGLSESESFLVYWSSQYVTHHETWIAAIQERPEDFLIVKYEDMLSHCADLLTAMISFSGLDQPHLTQEQIVMLAGMYTRRHNNWPSSDDITYRNRKFQQLEDIICLSELERLNNGLARRIEKIYSQLDALRYQPAPNGDRPALSA